MARQHTSEPRPTRHRQPKTGNARADTLIGLAEDFAANSGRETRPELRHFPAIALAMLPYVDLQTRALVAQVLADSPHLPQALAHALADDAIEVAQDVLERCESLSEGDLVRIVSDHSLAHCLAICRRESLPATVIDALLARGDADTDAALERTHRAAMEPDQISTLEARRAGKPSGQDARAHAAPRAATVLPDKTLAQLFWTGDADARQAVLAVMARKPAAAIHGLAQKFGPLAPKVGPALVQLARARRVEDLIAALARAAGVPRAHAARILADPAGEPLVVALAALGTEGDAAKALVNLLVPQDAAVRERLLQDFAALDKGRAGRLLQAMCGKPCDTQTGLQRHDGTVAQGQRQQQPGQGRAAGVPMRRKTDQAVPLHAS
ncbi:MAG: DUF2336 domain-containing protein [Rhodobiaceae bacterium]|nr:DUF2336 domain-containing protein [Rhodobiaceae bacterium]